MQDVIEITQSRGEFKLNGSLCCRSGLANLICPNTNSHPLISGIRLKSVRFRYLLLDHKAGSEIEGLLGLIGEYATLTQWYGNSDSTELAIAHVPVVTLYEAGFKGSLMNNTWNTWLGRVKKQYLYIQCHDD